MAKFEVVAMNQAQLLFGAFVLGSFFLMLPANRYQPNACGRDFHARLFHTHRFLVLTVVAAATVLLLVRTKVNSAAAAAARARALDAMQEGVGAVAAAKWPAASLRALLLLGVVLSFAASLLAVVTFEDGFVYRTGCDADHVAHGAVSPLGVALMVGTALLHGSSAWTAVFDN